MNSWEKLSSLKILLYIIFGIIIGLAWSYGVRWTSPTSNTNITPIESGATSLDYSVFSSTKAKEIYTLLSENYLDFSVKTKKEIEDEYIRAMVESLGDRHSVYFNEEDTKEFSEALLGDFEGIGAVIQAHYKGIKISKVIAGSPAEKAGLKDGDIVVSVDGKNIVGWTADEAVKIIRWPKGSPVNIGYIRAQDETVQFARVIRDVVNIPSIHGEMVDDGLGYIEIATFWEHTSQDFYKEFNTLVGSGAKGLILDFRNNWGGYLDVAVDIVSSLLPENTPVVKIKENDARKNATLYTKKGTRSNTKIPVVLLVNGMSASASEIVAWALQDHERAVIVGEKTYGKGSVQQPFDLKDGTMVKLTIAKWFTPKDRGIDELGITPDIGVYLFDSDFTEKNDRQLSAAKSILQHMVSSGATTKDTIQSFQENTFNQ